MILLFGWGECLVNTVGVPLPRDRGIRIAGVGDAGGRAVDWIAAQGLGLVETLAVNSYATALEVSRAGKRIQVGAGQGVGGDPTQGRRAAEAAKEAFQEALKGSTQVYLVAGLGGGTGSGVTPVVAHVAWQAGASVTAVVARPFAFEGQGRLSAAASAIAMLEQRTHELHVVNADRLLPFLPESEAPDLQRAYELLARALAWQVLSRLVM
jgi:cell division protein FtsZ